ncbi:hypothetical protein EDC01DRAFT_623145 [Geopyxis carbonaria]|nr:hypothetical protein EDC01DRAFT_623145 [Geopyxis carbonaria]
MLLTKKTQTSPKTAASKKAATETPSKNSAVQNSTTSPAESTSTPNKDVCTSPPPKDPPLLNTAFYPSGYIEFWVPKDKDPATTRCVPSLFRKPESSYSGSHARVSQPAYNRLCEMYNNCVYCRPEANGIIHIYEDYAGEGIGEVIVHEIAEYHKAAARGHLASAWACAEALALFFAGEDNDDWMAIGDGARVEDILRLVAWMFLDALARLDAADTQLAGIENIGLVLGSMCNAIGQCSDAYDEQGEIWRIEDWAKERGVQMRIVHGSYEDEGRDDWKAEFEKVLKKFKKEHYGPRGAGFGRIKMGLQKMSNRQKEELNKGNVF